jgi:MFS family permease
MRKKVARLRSRGAVQANPNQCKTILGSEENHRQVFPPRHERLGAAYAACLGVVGSCVVRAGNSQKPRQESAVFSDNIRDMSLSDGLEFRRHWTVILAAGVGVGLGVTGLPIYTTGEFILPLSAAFGWSRSATAGGLFFLTTGLVLMAPIIGALVDRFGVRPVAILAQLGICLGYYGLTLNGGSLIAYYVGWGVLAVLGAGTSPIVWTRAVASLFERNRGLALAITLCGTGVVAAVCPGLIGWVIAAYGWKAGFYALAAAPIVIGLPIVFVFLRSADKPASSSGEASGLRGATIIEAFASGRFWRLTIAFAFISIVIGGLIVSLPAMLADRAIALKEASRALSLLGLAIIGGRLTAGWFLDRFHARIVGATYTLLPALSCLLLSKGAAIGLAIFLIGISSGAEVDLLAYLVSRYFGMSNYAKIYGCVLAVFSAGVGIGPVFAGFSHDRSGSYMIALGAFAVMVVAAAGVISSLGRPEW